MFQQCLSHLQGITFVSFKKRPKADMRHTSKRFKYIRQQERKNGSAEICDAISLLSPDQRSFTLTLTEPELIVVIGSLLQEEKRCLARAEMSSTGNLYEAHKQSAAAALGLADKFAELGRQSPAKAGVSSIRRRWHRG